MVRVGGKICYSRDFVETKHWGIPRTHTYQESYIGIFTSKQIEITGSRGANLKSYGHESPADRQSPSDPEGKLQYEHNNMMPTGDQVRHSSADDI